MRVVSVRSLLSALVLAAAATAHALVPAHAEEAGAPSGVRGEALMWIKDAEGKLEELAEALPEAKYSWRPGKDVRSVGEVFMHVAATNYGVPGFWGVTPPAGFDFESYEKSLSKKADIQKALSESFDQMEKGMLALSDADFEKPAEFFGMKTTVRGAYLLLLSHAHEHLGQSIAYARMNQVAPPWTARQQAAEKARAAEKAKEKSAK